MRMIELHARDSHRAFLNPSIALTAVATWERFAVDLCWASERTEWSIDTAGWYEGYDSAVPWPESRPDRGLAQNKKYGQSHYIDGLLIRDGVLAEPLTSSWTLHVATSWFGADPTEWMWANYSAPPASENRDIIRQAMLGAKLPACCCPPLVRQEGRAGALLRSDDMPDTDADLRDWCYVWQKEKPGRPAIQHGYARGVVALIIQLIDITVATIRDHQDWTTSV